MLFQDSANDIFVDALIPKVIGNLFSDARATTPGIATLQFEDGSELVPETRALSARAVRCGCGREEISVFLSHKRQRGFEIELMDELGDGGPFDSTVLQELTPEGNQ